VAPFHAANKNQYRVAKIEVTASPKASATADEGTIRVTASARMEKINTAETRISASTVWANVRRETYNP
jgi:hypothetical protein